MTAPRPQFGGRLDSLTSLRAFAALGVVLLHAVGTRTTDHTLFDIPALSPIAEVGYLGVPFFFMLSGFVLTWGYRANNRVGSFYRRRFARIYPLHLLTAAAVAVAAVATGEALNFRVVAAVVLLVQAWIPDPTVYFGLNGPAWSLSCEAFFYAVTPFVVPRIIAGSRGFRLLVVAVPAVCMTVAALLIAIVPGWDRWDSALWVNPVFNVGIFLAGSALATVVAEGFRIRGGRLTATVAILLTGLIIGILSVEEPLIRPLATIIATPAVAILLVAFAGRDLSAGGGWARRLWLVRLGEWSFALYLLNGIALSALLLIVPPLSGVGAVFGLLIFLVLVNAVSGLVYTVFERPVEQFLRPSRHSEKSHPARPS